MLLVQENSSNHPAAARTLQALCLLCHHLEFLSQILPTVSDNWYHNFPAPNSPGQSLPHQITPPPRILLI